MNAAAAGSGLVFHLTAKLRRKLKVEAVRSPPAPSHPLLSWYGNLFHQDRRQYFLVVSEATLFAVLLFGRGLSTPESFAAAFLDALRPQLDRAGMSELYDRFIAPQAGRYTARPARARWRTKQTKRRFGRSALSIRSRRPSVTGWSCCRRKRMRTRSRRKGRRDRARRTEVRHTH
jgi:hypothetical protein